MLLKAEIEIRRELFAEVTSCGGSPSRIYGVTIQVVLLWQAGREGGGVSKGEERSQQCPDLSEKREIEKTTDHPYCIGNGNG